MWAAAVRPVDSGEDNTVSVPHPALGTKSEFFVGGSQKNCFNPRPGEEPGDRSIA